MNISVEKKFENPALKREDIEFKMEFDSSIPSREQAKSALSSAISIPKERIVIISIESNYGRKTVNARARVYQTEELAAAEKQHLLKRDGMVVAEEPKEAKPVKKKEVKKE